jgi:hypothetical protein
MASYQNGRLPDSALAPIASGRLAIDNYCAASWNAMNVDARARGLELLPTGSMSSYRTYDQQVYLYNVYQDGGPLAATPGTSNHGWGLAVDVATQAMRSMIDQIGHHYGWAKEWSDAQSEWWHLKYRAGVWAGSDPGPSGSGLAEVDVAGITTALAADGSLHVFAEALADGSVWYSWQRAGSSGWNGREPGQQIAGLTRFAPAPG